MRTTMDIPDELYRSVKMLALERDSSVRQLVLDALGILILQQPSSPPSERLKLPLIRSSRPEKLEMDNEKIYEIIDFP